MGATQLQAELAVSSWLKSGVSSISEHNRNTYAFGVIEVALIALPEGDPCHYYWR